MRIRRQTDRQKDRRQIDKQTDKQKSALKTDRQSQTDRQTVPVHLSQGYTWNSTMCEGTYSIQTDTDKDKRKGIWAHRLTSGWTEGK